MRGVLNRYLSGVPCRAVPFIGQERAGIIDGIKKKKPEAKEVLQRYRVFLFLCSSPADMADGARDSPTLGAHPLILSCPGVVNKLSRPILPRRAARRTRALIRGHTGSRQCRDRTSVTVGGMSFLLDRSGCRELPLGSAPEGKWRRPQHCKINVGAYNTVRALTCLEGLKVPVLSHPDGTFL